MNKLIILIFAVIALITINSCKKESATEPTNDPQTITIGYIAGNNGIIYKSTNEGNSWTALSSGVSNKLRSVFSTSNNNTWVVGDAGIILKTTNGGSNWAIQNSGTSVNLKQIYIDSNTGKAWIAGDGGTILFSSNGGSDWRKNN